MNVTDLPYTHQHKNRDPDIISYSFINLNILGINTGSWVKSVSITITIFFFEFKIPLYIDSAKPIRFLLIKTFIDLSLKNSLIQIDPVLSGLLSSSIIIKVDKYIIYFI